MSLLRPQMQKPKFSPAEKAANYAITENVTVGMAIHNYERQFNYRFSQDEQDETYRLVNIVLQQQKKQRMYDNRWMD